MWTWLHHPLTLLTSAILYIDYYSWWKTFAVSCLYFHSWKNVHGYQLLQACIVFKCKNLPKIQKMWNCFAANNKQYTVCFNRVSIQASIGDFMCLRLLFANTSAIIKSLSTCDGLLDHFHHVRMDSCHKLQDV